MTVTMSKPGDGDAVRGVEERAVERITAPLGGTDFEPQTDWQQDVLVSFWRRGSRDAVLASCAQRGTWDDTLARLVFSGALDDAALPLLARQNIRMFAAVCAWRDDLPDVAGEIVARTPGWQSHRGMDVLTRVIVAGAPFGGWEASMRNVRISTCLDFEG